MFWAMLVSVTVVAVSGLVAMYAAPRFEGSWSIDWYEFGIGLVVALAVVIPSVLQIGKALSVAEALTYQEFYNGVETSTPVQVENCRPGHSGFDESSGHSNCDNEYRTGETYLYTETYYVEVSDGCDKDGKCSSHQEARTRTEIGYIYNPYANNEYRYAITDSLGGNYRFPKTYVKDGEGYGGGAIPTDIPRGDPAEWLDAKKHLDEGDPRPVTRMFSYDNYILAAQDSLLNPFSEDVEQLKEEGILPEHTKNIMGDPLYGFSDSYADKVSFVGVEVADESAWQKSLMYFNAALGSQLRGDLHLVLIDDSLVNSPTDYLNAVKAYWLGDDFGRRAAAKNTIIVVAGVQGNKISWAQATTGMPFGNEVMLQGIANFLPDTPLDPAKVIGAPRTVVTPATGDEDDAVQVTISSKPGVLERVVLQDFPFLRACMECMDDGGEEIGYKSLVSKIEPSAGQRAFMIFIVGVLALFYWYFAASRRLFDWLIDWLPWVKKSSSDSDREEDGPDFREFNSSGSHLYGTPPSFEDKPKRERRYDVYDR